MRIILESVNGLPCAIEDFIINGIKASLDDFGYIKDVSEKSSDLSIVCDYRFFEYPSRKEILNKYSISEIEYGMTSRYLSRQFKIDKCNLCWQLKNKE